MFEINHFNFDSAFIDAGDLLAHERSVHGAQVLRCGANGCHFESTHRADALRHLSETHGDFLLQNYEKATGAGALISDGL